MRKCSTHAEILASSIEKWKKFDKNFDADRQYQLLYPDTSPPLFMPGGCKDFFELKSYKEELGKEYKNIVLFCARLRNLMLLIATMKTSAVKKGTQFQQRLRNQSLTAHRQ